MHRHQHLGLSTTSTCTLDSSQIRNLPTCPHAPSRAIRQTRYRHQVRIRISLYSRNFRHSSILSSTPAPRHRCRSIDPSPDTEVLPPAQQRQRFLRKPTSSTIPTDFSPPDRLDHLPHVVIQSDVTPDQIKSRIGPPSRIAAAVQESVKPDHTKPTPHTK